MKKQSMNIEEDMIRRKYCEQLKIPTFENHKDVGYIRLTLKAADAEDAAEAAYERDSLLAFILNSYLQNKVDDLIVANALLMEEEGIIPSRIFSLLDSNKPLVLPPYSLPCGICPEMYYVSFGKHLLYSDLNRYDWQQCLLSVFGPIFYSPRIEPYFINTYDKEIFLGNDEIDDFKEDDEIDDKTVKDNVKNVAKEVIKDMFKTPKKNRNHIKCYNVRKHADLFELTGCAIGLAGLGICAGFTWIKEKIEEKKHNIKNFYIKNLLINCYNLIIIY